MTVTGLVLAGGGGSRFGRPKALARWHGRLFVDHAVATLTGGGVTDVVVVLGAGAGEIRTAAPDLPRTVDNPDWATGLASSLRAGLAAATGSCALVLLVDMPGVTPAAVRRVCALDAPDVLALGGYGERRGHPVLIGRDHWAGVAASATGDRGARDYLRARPGQVRVVGVGDVADDLDVDVPEDLTRA